MSAIHALSLPLHSPSTPTMRQSLLLSSRPALTDSTNVNSHFNVCSPGYPKGLVYPTSATRTGSGWNDFESSTGSNSVSCHSRQHRLFSTPSLFPVAYKAPPTVSISLSAACSQSVSGEQFCGSRAQGLEPDLPDVRNVVPFPSIPLNGDMDVDMLDGTRIPCLNNHFSSAVQAPRKRRSAHSSVSSSQGTLYKDVKQKRPRKSRRQVAELWWLAVVHRSILRGIEVRQSIGESVATDRPLSGSHHLDAMDRVLAERIQRRLADNGCVEGRELPNPLPRVSSPSISVPSVNLLAPGRKAFPVDSFALSPELNSIEPERMAIPPPPFKAASCASLSITSHFSAPTSRSTSRRCHAHFDGLRHPCQSPLRLNIPRRSPSPPARTGTVPANGQMPTLTMPQLVASLTLTYHERSGSRQRGQTYKVTECVDNAGRSPPSMPCQAVQCSDGEAIHGERVHQSVPLCARLSGAPERKSPLSRVTYADG